MALDIGNEDFSSEFETDSESEKKRKRRLDLAVKRKPSAVAKVSTADLVEKSSKEEGIKQRHHILSLDAYARHKKLINDYFLIHKSSWSQVGRDTSKDRNDADIIRENHKFLWDDEDECRELSWDERLAKKYYDKLFKEYCIADLSRYKENKVALRWRIEKEVVVGKGQFICANKKCEVTDGLRSWEVNFAYLEQGEKKNALVKLRLCPSCSDKLNYHHQRREVNRKKHKRGDTRRQGDTSEEEEATTSESKKIKTEDSASVDTKQEVKEESASKEDAGTAAETIWSQPLQVTEDKSREEEFEEYLADMLL